MQAMQLNRQVTKEATAKALELRTRAVALVGEHPELLIGLAWVHLRQVRFGWSADPKASLAQASEYVEKAARSDPTDPEVFLVRGEITLIIGKHDEAIANARRAIELAPSMADAHANLSHWLDLAGKPDEAIPIMQNAMRLSPYYPDWYLFELGVQYQLSNQLEKARATYEAATKRSPDWAGGLPFLALATVEWQFGRKESARASMKAFRKYQPGYSLASYKQLTSAFVSGVCCEQFYPILRELGVPEK
ncbi:MAG: tetratricopeptide repeat protein [Alphaproteobacteria bacterium]|nr:tetratricopeptide repeat protein [Alphaproteobacteria bacterium]